MINKYLNSYPHRPNTAPHRRRLTRLGLAVALLVTASNLAVTTAQAAPSPGADASQSIFVMTTNDESLVDGILTASKADPEYRRKATALSQTWISAAQAGHAPSLGDLSALPAAQQITRLG
jgi:hypothetical protein